MRYQSASKVKFSPQQPIDEYDSRFEIDARATYAFGESERHEVSLFGKNLTEREVLRRDPGSARRLGFVLLRAERGRGAVRPAGEVPLLSGMERANAAGGSRYQACWSGCCA